MLGPDRRPEIVGELLISRDDRPGRGREGAVEQPTAMTRAEPLLRRIDDALARHSPLAFDAAGAVLPFREPKHRLRPSGSRSPRLPWTRLGVSRLHSRRQLISARRCEIASAFREPTDEPLTTSSSPAPVCATRQALIHGLPCYGRVKQMSVESSSQRSRWRIHGPSAWRNLCAAGRNVEWGSSAPRRDSGRTPGSTPCIAARWRREPGGFWRTRVSRRGRRSALP